MMVEINDIITLSHTEKYLHTDDLVHSHETENIRSATVNYAWKSNYFKIGIFFLLVTRYCSHASFLFAGVLIGAEGIR